MIAFLTIFAALGGTLLGIGIQNSRVRNANQGKEIAIQTMHDYRDGKLDASGFRIGSALEWKKSCLEAQKMLIDSRRVNVRLMEQNDKWMTLAGAFDAVLPEANVNYDMFVKTLIETNSIWEEHAG